MTSDQWLLGLEEIRVRVGQPMEFCYGVGVKYFEKKENKLCFYGETEDGMRKKQLYRATQEDIREMLNYISNYSLYAYKEQIRQGYLTIEGGHRIGVAGQVVVCEGKMTGISPITFLNIRVAQEKMGCAKQILPYLAEEGQICNTLILSAPGAGKTTLLRDMVRALSDGELLGVRWKVGVVDERSEIAAGYHGIPQNDIGWRTDVLDGCPKAEGMQLMIRTMSPQVLAVDELGRKEDFLAVEDAACCGCHVIGTIHAGDLRELAEKPFLRHWMEQRLFERFVFLEKKTDGTRKMSVYNARMERIGC